MTSSLRGKKGGCVVPTAEGTDVGLPQPRSRTKVIRTSPNVSTRLRRKGG